MPSSGGGRLEVRVLGPLEVERDGSLLNLRGRKQRAVLAVLVVNAGEVVSADRLADAVWAGEPPASVGTTLRGYVSNLRRALEPDRGPKDPPTILRTTPAGYVLDVGGEAIDARRFEQLVALGRERRAAGDLDGAAGRWSEALSLWRGDAFQDFAYDDFVQVEINRLRELRLACTEDLFEVRIELGQHDAVIGDIEAFADAHLGRERSVGLRMLALYRCGRQTEALGVYEAERRRLADELGVDPSPELRAVYEGILRQDETLAPAVPSPPSGKQTLTFLLGDVELSTERLRALGDEYTDALEEHRRILEGALRSHGGRAIRAYGDEVFAAFDAATDAVEAAVAAQIALTHDVSDDARRLPVRMGLHTGEATFSAGEYVGLAVHLAARIMGAAHGGQVLVSGATKELFEAEEGATVVLRDTGMHLLKDIPEAVRLFQVIHPDLRADFPALRSRTGRSDNLPTRLTSFVGRDRDLRSVESGLAEARLVTLTGVGGVGKTRLALEGGRRLVPRYADGVWLCELAAIGDGDTMVQSIANTLGIDPQIGRPRRESLLGALRQRESLLILDNCEHLLGPVAELVEEILHEARAVDVLATSREALGVEGERAHPVRSLSVSSDPTADAVRLFEDRARAVRPDFAIAEGNPAAVADVCERLDGIPLAIELAAARVTSLSPAQIAQRLDEGFHFLRSGRRAAVDRHRTLHGAIDWSYAMLSEAERLLFDRLSVFAGGFTLEAAENVCGRDLDLDVADGLASLVAKSMIEADVSGDEARYDLLETMRQYAQDRLAEREEGDDILRAHAVHYVELVERLPEAVTQDSLRAVRSLLVEFDNVRAAQGWAQSSGDLDLMLRVVGVSSFFLASLELPEVSTWAEDALATPGAEEHPLFPMALIAAAAVERRGGNVDRQRELVIRASELVDDPDDQRRLGSLISLGLMEGNAGRLDEARPWIEEYTRVARANNEPLHEAFGHCCSSILESTDGNHTLAVETAERAYALGRTHSPAMEGVALYYLGDALSQAGDDLERALDCFDRSIALCRDHEMHFWVGVSLVAMAALRARHGDPIEALQMFPGLLDRWRRIGDWTRQWVTLANLAELFGRIGSDTAAVALIAASEASDLALPIVGLQGVRIAELSLRLADRMGAEAFAAGEELGRTMSDVEVVAFAKAEIEKALAAVPTWGLS